ncbi:pseudouridine synthase deg1 [Mycoemilia scoparia]|uniref:Pseudouridine synthase deg1 n=1 Tax=Mycoemilia scoparia TaxID=417184 RepID=A0A9W8DRQ4_9FUNG|nr:pseudouridine synthase deg1 [Mycoemilia scoparia]
MSNPQQTSNNYSGWTKDQLIQNIQNLESKLNSQSPPPPPPSTPLGPKIKHSQIPPHSPSDQHITKKQKKSKEISQKREFDFNQFEQRKVAFKLSYLGWPYHGFAKQGINTSSSSTTATKLRESEAEYPTVEGEIFKALMQCKLIESESSCQYSRCGRTDKGVSGFGQVISLYVRSSQKKKSLQQQQQQQQPLTQSGEDGDKMDIDIATGTDRTTKPALTTTTAPITTTTNTGDHEEGFSNLRELDPHLELPYTKMLNKILPPFIRIHAWSPVRSDFDARFSCKSRFYRYIFSSSSTTTYTTYTNPQNSPHPKQGSNGYLDVEKMKTAAKKFLGTHDFRNFCRLDPAKQIMNFERTVLEIDIKEITNKVGVLPGGPLFINPPAAATTTTTTTTSNDNLISERKSWWQLELRGTAFLWHQVRCMMGILFLVGQGYEQPEIVDQLLDVKNLKGKPQYEMASDLPLVLADCAFDPNDVSWIYYRVADDDMTGLISLDKSISQSWQELNTKAILSTELLDIVNETRIQTRYCQQQQQQQQQQQEQSNNHAGGETDSTKNHAAAMKEITWAKYRELGYGRRTDGVDLIVGGGRVNHLKRYKPIMERPRAEDVFKRNSDWAKRKVKQQ